MSAGSGQARRLDVITIGRCSVDLYGQQIGSRLEDIASFAKSVGGCPSNIAIGTARLGLKSGLITRVGDEQMGRYVKEQMAREGVALDGIATDPERLTSLVLLSVENDKTFSRDVTTLFNNDYDNSSGFGIGKDEQYIESYEGELITVKTPLRARYVRLYTNGNTDNQMNHYTEVEVFAASREQ